MGLGKGKHNDGHAGAKAPGAASAGPSYTFQDLRDTTPDGKQICFKNSSKKRRCWLTNCPNAHVCRLCFSDQHTHHNCDTPPSQRPAPPARKPQGKGKW